MSRRGFGWLFGDGSRDLVHCSSMTPCGLYGPHPPINRTACAWLIRRFVDRDAEFAFAPGPDAARAFEGTPLDMRGVELGHHEGRCSFESILHKYQLTDPALHEIAAMVHDADLDDEKFRSPEVPGLDAAIRRLGLVIEDDQELLRLTDRLYDGLYAWVRIVVAPHCTPPSAMRRPALLASSFITHNVGKRHAD